LYVDAEREYGMISLYLNAAACHYRDDRLFLLAFLRLKRSHSGGGNCGYRG
jgi:hypothetical protein